MATEFDLIYEDFEAELVAIEGMIASLATRGGAPTSARSRIAGANAAVLLLAATFEEFVRQEVRAIFVAKASTAPSFDVFPEKIAAAVWRRSLERLARQSLEDLARDPNALSDRLNATVKFCIDRDPHADVGEAVAHNDNNMRPTELNRLFNQLGLKNMLARAAESPELTGLLGCDDAGKANIELQFWMEEFFQRRNTIAHNIQLNSSSGPPALAGDIARFRELGRALAYQSGEFCKDCNPRGRSESRAIRPRRLRQLIRDGVAALLRNRKS